MTNLFESRGIDLNLLQSSFMDEAGWHLNPQFSESEVQTIYQTYRELILDGEMPIAKIAGFKITSGDGFMTNSAGSIFKCNESLFEIINNLQDIIFLPLDSNLDCMVDVKFGDLYARMLKENVIPANRLVPVNDLYLFHMSKSTQLMLRVHTGKGVVSAEENHKAFSEKSLIPIMSDHSLVKYVNIAYVDGHTIKHKIHNGLSFESYKRLIDNYLYKSVKSVTQKVVYNVEEIFSNLYKKCSKYRTKAVDPMYSLYKAELAKSTVYAMYRNQGKLELMSQIEYNMFTKLFTCEFKKDTIDRLITECRFTENASKAIAKVLHEYV